MKQNNNNKAMQQGEAIKGSSKVMQQNKLAR
jgi:hypothetical protein